jgi:hypothetical protein
VAYISSSGARLVGLRSTVVANMWRPERVITSFGVGTMRTRGAEHVIMGVVIQLDYVIEKPAHASYPSPLMDDDCASWCSYR